VSFSINGLPGAGMPHVGTIAYFQHWVRGNNRQSKSLPGWAGGNFRDMSADDERDAEHWRRLETEARTIASKMTDPEPRRIMFFIAEGYKLLADRAEFRKTHNDQ